MIVLVVVSRQVSGCGVVYMQSVLCIPILCVICGQLRRGVQVGVARGGRAATWCLRCVYAIVFQSLEPANDVPTLFCRYRIHYLQLLIQASML
jgi:hypothetical protein